MKRKSRLGKFSFSVSFLLQNDAIVPPSSDSTLKLHAYGRYLFGTSLAFDLLNHLLVANNNGREYV